jgi:hypothetical protein
MRELQILRTLAGTFVCGLAGMGLVLAIGAGCSGSSGGPGSTGGTGGSGTGGSSGSVAVADFACSVGGPCAPVAAGVDCGAS